MELGGQDLITILHNNCTNCIAIAQVEFIVFNVTGNGSLTYENKIGIFPIFLDN